MEYPTIDKEITREELLTDLLNDPVKALQLTGGISLYEFIQLFWNEISDDEFKPNWHIPYLCEQLEEIAYRVAENKPKVNDLIINIPPGTTKTIVCSVMFPVWCWTKWYWMKFITASYSDALALESAEKSRDLVRCDKFKVLYPAIDIKQDKDTKSNFRVCKKEFLYKGQVPRVVYGGGRFSTSVGGAAMGFHAHILIIDDPINPKQAVSEKLLGNANTWMDHTISTRKTDKEVSTTILIMQRLHQDDPTGHLLSKNKKNIKHICLPGEIHSYKDKVKPVELLDRYVDGLLDPVRLNVNALKDLEADLGQYGYAGQIGQHPSPPGGGMFKVDHLQIIQNMPNPVNFIEILRYWDKAATEGAGCRTAGVKIAKLTNNRYLVLDVKMGQWESEKREKIMKETAIADGREVTIGLEQEGGSGGKESAEASVRNLAGFSVYLDHPTGDKVYRADPFSVQVNNGNVMLLRGDWNHDYIEELRAFPNGKYKDQVDASSAAFNKLAAKRAARMLT